MEDAEGRRTEDSKVPAAGNPKDMPINKDNANFVQISRGYLQNWRGLIRKSPLSAELLMFLIEKMGRTTNAVVISYKIMTELTKYNRTSVAKAIKVLKDDNWVAAIKVGNATAYCVNERVVWQASNNQRHYAMFSATVVASESEQESDFRKKAKEKINNIPFIDFVEQPIVNAKEEVEPPEQREMDMD